MSDNITTNNTCRSSDKIDIFFKQIGQQQIGDKIIDSDLGCAQK